MNAFTEFNQQTTTVSFTCWLTQLGRWDADAHERAAGETREAFPTGVFHPRHFLPSIILKNNTIWLSYCFSSQETAGEQHDGG